MKRRQSRWSEQSCTEGRHSETVPQSGDDEISRAERTLFLAVLRDVTRGATKKVVRP
jgi:hypothetical protein